MSEQLHEPQPHDTHLVSGGHVSGDNRPGRIRAINNVTLPVALTPGQFLLFVGGGIAITVALSFIIR